MQTEKSVDSLENLSESIEGVKYYKEKKTEVENLKMKA